MNQIHPTTHKTRMFDTPDDLLRFSSKQAHESLQKVKSEPGKKAVMTFLSDEPDFIDYLDIVHHALSALTIYNEVIVDTATGPNADPSLEAKALRAAGYLKEMRVAFDHMLDQYGFQADSPNS
jgi:hypothetical protein